MTQSVALVSFLKNEGSDISGWLAWHAAWGVKTFYIFDDHSTDGTWELLRAASTKLDIRLFRTKIDGSKTFISGSSIVLRKQSN